VGPPSRHSAPQQPRLAGACASGLDLAANRRASGSLRYWDDRRPRDGCDGRKMPTPVTPPSPAMRAFRIRSRVREQFRVQKWGQLEKAKALLSQTAPRVDLNELHLSAMRALVTELERKKYATTNRPRQRVAQRARTRPATPPVAEPAPDGQLAGGDTGQSDNCPEPRPQLERGPQYPRQRGRQVPAALRRAVLERDDGPCTHRSDSGERLPRDSAGSSPITRNPSHEVASIAWTRVAWVSVLAVAPRLS
jgi:hypothetical protein